MAPTDDPSHQHGADLRATSIVDQTLALSASHAHAPAVDVLDLVMQGSHRWDLGFDPPGQDFGDWTDPSWGAVRSQPDTQCEVASRG